MRPLKSSKSGSRELDVLLNTKKQITRKHFSPENVPRPASPAREGMYCGNKGCQKTLSSPLRRCSKCHQEAYCDKICQVVHACSACVPPPWVCVPPPWVHAEPRAKTCTCVACVCAPAVGACRAALKLARVWRACRRRLGNQGTKKFAMLCSRRSCRQRC